MTALDPMRTVWDALHNAGCKPHGEPHNFRAACPAHEGSNPDALRVYEGTNRQVVLGCYAHSCDWRSITDALGLPPSALFPAGHKNGPRAKPSAPVKPRPLSAGAAFLDTLTLAGYRWRAVLLLPECPYCGSEHCVLRFADNPEAGDVAWERFGVAVDCSLGCTAGEVRRAVEVRAAIAEKLDDERRAA